MEGETLLNGHPKVQATFSRVMGYVEQFDLHIPQVGEQAYWKRGGRGLQHMEQFELHILQRCASLLEERGVMGGVGRDLA